MQFGEDRGKHSGIAGALTRGSAPVPAPSPSTEPGAHGSCTVLEGWAELLQAQFSPGTVHQPILGHSELTQVPV